MSCCLRASEPKRINLYTTRLVGLTKNMINLPKLFATLVFGLFFGILFAMPRGLEVEATEVGGEIVSIESANFQTSSMSPIEKVSVKAETEKAPVIVRTSSRVVNVVLPEVMNDLIQKASEKYGADQNWMQRVMFCESRGNSNAYNARSGASGLYQFLPSTWRTTPYGSQSIWDAEAQVNAAAWMYSKGRAREWSCK